MKTNQSVRMSLPKARKIISENEFLLQDRLQKIQQIYDEYRRIGYRLKPIEAESEDK